MKQMEGGGKRKAKFEPKVVRREMQPPTLLKRKRGEDSIIGLPSRRGKNRSKKKTGRRIEFAWGESGK